MTQEQLLKRIEEVCWEDYKCVYRHVCNSKNVYKHLLNIKLGKRHMLIEKTIVYNSITNAGNDYGFSSIKMFGIINTNEVASASVSFTREEVGTVYEIKQIKDTILLPHLTLIKQK